MTTNPEGLYINMSLRIKTDSLAVKLQGLLVVVLIGL